jgi:hypothetical protein
LCARNTRTRSTFGDTPSRRSASFGVSPNQVDEFDRFPLKTGETSGAFEQLPPLALRVDPRREILELVMRKDEPAAELIDQIRTIRLVGQMVGIDPSGDRDQPGGRTTRPWNVAADLIA